MYKNRKFRGGGKGSVPKQKAVNSNLNPNILCSINENAPSSSLLPPPPKFSRVEIQEQNEARSIFDEVDEDIMSSQASIPASQPPTQMRYFSQRSTLLGKTQSKSLARAPNTYFEMVLMKSGADLDQTDNFTLSCDHVTFVNNFRSVLKKHQDFPQNVETFVDGFTKALDDQIMENKLLTGCNISIPLHDTCSQSQDSMTMNFLMVDFLQEKLIRVLLKKIDYYSKKDSPVNTDFPILPLYLSQLKFIAPLYGDLLYTEMIGMYSSASLKGKNDIVTNAESIFDPIKHDVFVNFLIDDSNTLEELLCPNNVRTFTNLYLSTKIQMILRKKILQYIKMDCSITRFPVLIKFLLKVLNEEDDNLTELVNDLRCSLDWTELPNISQMDIQKIQLDIFMYIKQGLIRSKRLYDIWLKSIQNLSFNDTKPIDLIIFLMLMAIREEKSHSIENLIRRQIKLERLQITAVEKCKKRYINVLELYGDVLLQILHNFLKEKNLIVCDFAKSTYKVLFESSETFQKKILNKLVELTCNKSSSDVTTTSLEVLNNLNNNFTKDIQNYGMLLLPLLEQISEMNLNQSRIIMGLLCSIAYPLPPLSECPTLQDHIDMLVKKQICNRTVLVKKQGIIGTVQLINHIVRTANNDGNYDDLDESYATVNDLPEGRGKQAASYITRILSATNYCTETLALFYDELAAVLSNQYCSSHNAGIDKHFLTWLCDLITLYFQQNFVLECDIPISKIDGVELSFQKCINALDDSTDAETVPIAINIGLSVLSPSAEASESITVLASLFNLTCVLHSIRSRGNLESVNALLGCPIYLPTFFDTADCDTFDEYDENISKKIFDIYFYSENWFRLIIGAYADQPDEKLHKNILLRLNGLIRLESLITDLLKKAPDNYVPPVSEFFNTEKATTFKRPIGRARKTVNTKNKTNIASECVGNEAEHTEGMTFLATVQTQGAVNQSRARINQNKSKLHIQKSQFESVYHPKEIYRQMDINIILILRTELVLEYPLPESKHKKNLGLLEFRFLMNDLVTKIESIDGVKKFSSDQPVQHIVNVSQFMKNSQVFLPTIFSNLKKLQTELLVQLENVNGVLGNAELYTDRSNYLKVCFGLCLRFIAAYFSYTGFDVETIKKSLQSIAVKKNCEIIEELAANIMETLFVYEKSIIDITSAVHLLNTLKAINKISQKANFEKKIRALCKTLLCRKWHSFEGGMEKGANCNILLDQLIKGFLKNSTLKRLLDILKIVSDECKLMKGKDAILKSFPNINKANFPMLFKGLCEELIAVTSLNVSGRQNEIESLKIWENSCDNLNKLLEIVQTLDGVPRNFALFLKYSNLFIKLFLQRGLPIFESSLRQNPERFNQLLKNLQINTRFLHNLCCHSKAIKNITIVAQIPFIRETVENLLFKVKAALAANNCSSVFWMGTLKNKDLTGSDISSQTLSLTETDPNTTNNPSNSDEEIPDDDSSADETVLEEANETNMNRKSSTDSSRSNCF